MIELRLTEEQANIVSSACEFYARILMGQFQEIPRVCPGTQLLCNHKEIQDAWLNLRSYIYHDLGGPGHSYGIGKFPQADKAFDVHQAIRYVMGDKREPFSYYKLPECRKVADKHFHETVPCRECKHYHEETAYCDLNSYFVDSDGLCCSPADSPNWEMWQPDETCSRAERRVSDEKQTATDVIV